MGSGSDRRRRSGGGAGLRAGHGGRRGVPPLRPRRCRLPAVKRALVAVGLIVAFVVGVAVGESLADGSKPAGTQTLVRTLQPLPLAPAARDTVTVTVSNP